MFYSSPFSHTTWSEFKMGFNPKLLDLLLVRVMTDEKAVLRPSHYLTQTTKQAKRRRGAQQIFRLAVRLAKRKTASCFWTWKFWRHKRLVDE